MWGIVHRICVALTLIVFYCGTCNCLQINLEDEVGNKLQNVDDPAFVKQPQIKENIVEIVPEVDADLIFSEAIHNQDSNLWTIVNIKSADALKKIRKARDTSQTQGYASIYPQVPSGYPYNPYQPSAPQQQPQWNTNTQNYSHSGYPSNPVNYNPSNYPGQYNPTQGPYNPNQGPYNPNQGPYNPTQGPYNPAHGPYNPNQGSYNPSQGSYSPGQGPYSPQRPYNSSQGQYNPSGGYNPSERPYNPSQGPYSPQGPYNSSHGYYNPNQRPYNSNQGSYNSSYGSNNGLHPITSRPSYPINGQYPFYNNQSTAMANSTGFGHNSYPGQKQFNSSYPGYNNYNPSPNTSQNFSHYPYPNVPSGRPSSQYPQGSNSYGQNTNPQNNPYSQTPYSYNQNPYPYSQNVNLAYSQHNNTRHHYK